MFITQTKYSNMKDRITNLEGQVEALHVDKVLERDKKLAEIGNLDDKIIHLEKSKRKLQNDVDDKVAENKRAEENIKHKVKIVMEKHDLEVAQKKQDLVVEKNDEVASLKDKFRDKREKQLELQGSEMKGMYTEMMKILTSVQGTITAPTGARHGNSD